VLIFNKMISNKFGINFKLGNGDRIIEVVKKVRKAS